MTRWARLWVGTILDPYVQAVGELKSNCVGFEKQYRKQQRHSPI